MMGTGSSKGRDPHPGSADWYSRRLGNLIETRDEAATLALRLAAATDTLAQVRQGFRFRRPEVPERPSALTVTDAEHAQLSTWRRAGRKLGASDQVQYLLGWDWIRAVVKREDLALRQVLLMLDAAEVFELAGQPADGAEIAARLLQEYRLTIPPIPPRADRRKLAGTLVLRLDVCSGLIRRGYIEEGTGT